jgi:fibro-slime domain-containing protein
MALVDCGGGGGDTSNFDSGAPIGTTVDSGSGTLGDDQGDATAPGITVTGTGGGTGDGGGGGVDCDATPLACVPEVCGDGVIEPGETCDDGNTASGDGCSSSCQLEGDYYACVADQPCVDTRNCDELVEAGVIKAGSDSGCSAPVKVAVCGDGFLDPGEACDTGSDVGTPASGCAADCSTAFQGYVCPTAGKDCTNTWICGDGKIEGSEQCDEGPGNQTAGCSPATATPACAVTPGWSCTIPGVPCVAAKCGDGIVAGSEQCDVGTHTQAGCDATCHLATTTTVTAPTATTQPSTVVTNYACSYATPNPGYETCAPTVCGNHKVEGTERCDDGNNKAYDGCSADCQLEPSCPNGACVAVCGDGLVFDFAGEACDDGNTLNGDGCSSTCTVEQGYSCTTLTQTPPTTVDVPVVYRDMLYYNTTYKGALDATALVYGHPDFERYGGTSASLNLVKSTLSNGIPVFNATTGSGTSSSNGIELTSAADFTDWYADGIVNPDKSTPALTQSRSVRVDGHDIRMTLRNGAYVFDSNCDPPYGTGTYDASNNCSSTAGGFLPIDNQGWNDPKGANVNQTYSTTGHNFSFTTQFRYYFTYDATAAASKTPPTLLFTGDDDVWVFLDNQLALDLGGLHSRLAGTLILNTAMATTLGLVDQHVYEVDLFNAERHTSGSNFRLSLTGFTKKVSSCTTVCGDGFRTPNELCDDGTAPNPIPAGSTADDYNTSDGDYGTCTLSCKLGPYCGDATPNKPEEACDNGVNQTPYATSAAAALVA